MDIRQRIDPLAFVSHLATRPGASELDFAHFSVGLSVNPEERV
jgi:hypothetical protein